MIAIQLLPQNFDDIIALANAPYESLNSTHLNAEYQKAKTLGEKYFFVPNFESKFYDKPWPWVMIRTDYLAEEFDYVMPVDPADQFEITRK